METIRCLELFKAVVNHKSFCKAAAANHLPPESVTRAVQKLETELGVRLLHRTTRKVALTDVGMSVYDRAVSLLDSYLEIQRVGEESSRRLTGTIRVAIHRLLGFEVLSSALDEYMRSHNNVSLEVEFFDDRDDPLGNGSDIAISLQADIPDFYIAKRISSLSMSLYVGARFSKNGNTIAPSDILPEDRLSAGARTWNLILEGSDKRLSLPCNSRFRSDSAEAIAMATVGGLGIALLPSTVAAPYVDARRLFPLFENWKSEPLAITIIYRSRRFVPERVRSLISYVNEGINLRKQIDVTKTLSDGVLDGRVCEKKRDQISQLLSVDV